MLIEDKKIVLDETDWKEIFSLFCSPTQYEIDQIYSQESDHFWKGVDLNEFHSITGEKRETAIDAWRSVILFLRSKGFALLRGDDRIDLSFIEDYICD